MPRKRKKLSEKDIDKEIKALSGWTTNKKSTHITKTYALPSFITGLAFIAKITVHAEVENHHPTVELSYGKVKVTLTSNDTGGLTKSDFDLATKIDSIRL